MQEENNTEKEDMPSADGLVQDASPSPKRFKRALAIAVGLALAAILGVAAGAALLPMSAPSADKAGETQEATGKKVVNDKGDIIGTVVDEEGCEHDWTVTYKTVHHDAVTHTETVAPVYENKTSYHTVCNDCKQVIDGKADEHIRETGHSGYSTNVPITGEVLVSEGYSHEVTDTPAYDETVADELVCTLCGERKPAETPPEAQDAMNS